MKNDIFDVSNRVALVTGASSGFGAHFAKVLADHGAKVIVCARRLDRLTSLVDDITTMGGKAFAVPMDVTDATSVKNAFDEGSKQFGLIDIVSNNAGVADSKMAIATDETSWDFVMDTNLKGMWLVAMEAGRRLIAAKAKGSIVNTASILGLRTAISQSSYATSKAAVVQLSKTLALEWARKHIRVNALCPGYFVTELNEDYFNSEKGRAYIQQSPAQRTGELDELTAPFMMLASEAGSFVNGVALPVDGAHTLGNM
ncbi:SDR family oxidoreductase [Maricurvus nonylphenolicus]|uniref:SDR family NAD(P)-dependent oxidoreductase n=1 Tax=Maricurvus nonylphenolicus TaxID=1008307 RepID=UPI0036F3CF14